ncbi:MAG: Hpt domain-containing protein [Desulfobacteraceae bacterium]|nr:Hpt domain-containing protein [Desulfobacteraceae bacterium]
MDFKVLGDNLGLEEDEFRELAELFVETGRDDFIKLNDAISNKDTDQIRTTAHTLAGAAGNLGLMDIHEPAKKIEMDAINNREDDLASLAAVVKERMDELESFVNSLP